MKVSKLIEQIETAITEGINSIEDLANKADNYGWSLQYADEQGAELKAGGDYGILTAEITPYRGMYMLSITVAEPDAEADPNLAKSLARVKNWGARGNKYGVEGKVQTLDHMLKILKGIFDIIDDYDY